MKAAGPGISGPTYSTYDHRLLDHSTCFSFAPRIVHLLDLSISSDKASEQARMFWIYTLYMRRDCK